MSNNEDMVNLPRHLLRAVILGKGETLDKIDQHRVLVAAGRLNDDHKFPVPPDMDSTNDIETRFKMAEERLRVLEGGFRVANSAISSLLRASRENNKDISSLLRETQRNSNDLHSKDGPVASLGRRVEELFARIERSAWALYPAGAPKEQSSGTPAGQEMGEVFRAALGVPPSPAAKDSTPPEQPVEKGGVRPQWYATCGDPANPFKLPKGKVKTLAHARERAKIYKARARWRKEQMERDPNYRENERARRIAVAEEKKKRQEEERARHAEEDKKMVDVLKKLSMDGCTHQEARLKVNSAVGGKFDRLRKKYGIKFVDGRSLRFHKKDKK